MKFKIEDRELLIKSRKKKGLKDIYDKISENTMGINLNEIHIKYEIKKEDNQIRIFGDKFVYYNYKHCKIIFMDKIYNLKSHLVLKKIKGNKKIIEIKLRGIKNILIAIEMFYKCSSLKSLPDISKWNTDNITNINGLF